MHTCQVWSLAQFYSVDFSKSRIDVKKCVFNKRTIKGPRRRRGSCWEERKRAVFPRQRVIDLPSSQINDFVILFLAPQIFDCLRPHLPDGGSYLSMNPEVCVWMAGKSKCDLVEQSAVHETRHISPNNREVNAAMSRIPPYRCSN